MAFGLAKAKQDYFKEAWLRGDSVKDIAAHLSVRPDTLNSARRALGLPVRRERSVGESYREKLRELKQSGLTLREIAEQEGKAPTTIQTHIRQIGREPLGLSVKDVAVKMTEKSWRAALIGRRNYLMAELKIVDNLLGGNLKETENKKERRLTIQHKPQNKFLEIAKQILLRDGPLSLDDIFEVVERDHPDSITLTREAVRVALAKNRNVFIRVSETDRRYWIAGVPIAHVA